MKKIVKTDITIIMIASLIFAILYIALEGIIMDYGRDISNPLFLRFIPVLLIQFGMSVLGILIVFLKNKEKLSDYGLVKKNVIVSVGGCLLVSMPTVIFLWLTNDIHGFLPFQGMFLTKEINTLKQPKKFWNLGAFVCALIAITIHGMIGVDIKIIIEAIATFVLMYGSIVIYDKTNNAWGNILIFFVIWNAL